MSATLARLWWRLWRQECVVPHCPRRADWVAEVGGVLVFRACEQDQAFVAELARDGRI